jgi:hypothetical protein
MPKRPQFLKRFKKFFSRKKKFLVANKDISKDSTVEELFNSDQDISLLMELLTPSNIIFGKEVKPFTKFEFQEVHDILNFQEEGKVLEIVEILTKKNLNEILSIDSQSFLKFVKWINAQTKIILLIYGTLQSDEMDSEDMAYQNAGADKLNIYKENMVYYSINKNPATWPNMRKVIFEEMFTKLMIDRDMKGINKKYIKSLKK